MTIDWAILSLIILGLFSPSKTEANDIRVAQIGDNIILNVTQDGKDNKITGKNWGNSNAYMNGSNSVVNYSQTGDNNRLGIYTYGNNTVMSLTQTGNNNTSSMDGHGSNLIMSVTQNGNNNTSYSEMGNGGDDNNSMTVTQDGNNNYTNPNINGDNNLIVIDQDGNNHYATRVGTWSGDNNSIAITQNGSQHENAQLGMNGNSNTVDISQGFSGESNLTRSIIVGDSNALTVWQGKRFSGYTDTTEGGDHEANWTITGNNNLARSYQTDDATNCCASAHLTTNTIEGDGNSVTVRQRVSENEGFVQVVGDSNFVDLYQSGGGNAYGNITATGNNHSTTNIQKGGGVHSITLNMTNGGGAYNINTLQDSTSNQSYTLEGTCFTGTCGISVVQN